MIYLPLLAALTGAIVGSALTAGLAHLATSRRERRQARLKVLMVLMSGRGEIVDADVARSINSVPILFHDVEKVRRAYLHLCSVPAGPTIDLYRRYNDLALAIAASLGFGDLTATDMDLGFYPMPKGQSDTPQKLANTQPAPKMPSGDS